MERGIVIKFLYWFVPSILAAAVNPRTEYGVVDFDSNHTIQRLTIFRDFNFVPEIIQKYR